MKSKLFEWFTRIAAAVVAAYFTQKGVSAGMVAAGYDSTIQHAIPFMESFKVTGAVWSEVVGSLFAVVTGGIGLNYPKFAPLWGKISTSWNSRKSTVSSPSSAMDQVTARIKELMTSNSSNSEFGLTESDLTAWKALAARIGQAEYTLPITKGENNAV